MNRQACAQILDWSHPRATYEAEFLRLAAPVADVADRVVRLTR